MKQSDLEQKLNEAQYFAKIVLTFTTRMMPDGVNSLAAVLGHFQNNGLIVVVGASEEKNTLTICKTFVFKEKDARALSEVVAKHITGVELRSIPEHTLSLVEAGEGWQLKLEGGNKLMRGILAQLPEAAIKNSGLDPLAHNALDTNGAVTLDLDANDDIVLEFAEIAAFLFRTELRLAF